MDRVAVTRETPALMDALDVEAIRAQFPVLSRKVGRYPLVYVDNAATSQKPQQVIDRLVAYYTQQNSNVHRGAHTLSREATSAYEEARETVRAHLNAKLASEIIFTSGTTASVNLVASTYGRSFLGPGDQVLISAMEHHSNIVPWQLVCKEIGAELVVAPIHDSGELDTAAFLGLLRENTKIVALCHVSNTLGTINPVKPLITAAKDMGAAVLLDGAQAAAHLTIDVQELGCDFYCLSAHKMFGPTGIGSLYVRNQIAEQMPPYQGGGEMIQSVSFDKTSFAEPPYRFEAGTPNIAGAAGFAEAIRFLAKTDLGLIDRYEQELLRYATQAFETIDGLTIVGTAEHKVPVISFVVDGVHPLDLGTMMDTRGIAVRTGHHCTEPLMDRLGITGTVRASFAFYNSRQEVDYITDTMRSLIAQMR